MAKLSDVQFSMNGEPGQEQQHVETVEAGIIADLRVGNDHGDTTVWHIFKLVSNTKQGGVYVPNIDDVVNPATKTKENPKGQVERMRLLSGVSSIWMKEQKDVSADYVKQNGRSLHFVRGTKILRIADYDTTALEFARLCSHNIGSPSRRTGSKFEFYEYDAAKEEREAFAREDFELDMALLAKQAKPEDMKKHASFLGIRLINDLGLPKTDDGVRIEYTRYAKRFPQYFKDTLGSKEIEIGWLVRKAILDNKIEIGREPGRIFWANGGGMICSVPRNDEPVKYLTELAMTNSEEGRTFKEQLQRLGT